MDSIVFAPLAQAFGLMVAHSFWQIALIWLVFKAFEWRFSQRHQSIYLLSLCSMLTATVWAVATFLGAWAQFRPLGGAISTVTPVLETMPSATVPTGASPAVAYWDTAQIWLEAHAALIGWAWLACAFLLWLRLIGGWWLAQELRSRAVMAATDTFQLACNYWAKRLSIHTKVLLLESPHISEPLCLGFWKPVVLFPMGMLLKLSPTQVEALLLHELAHIRRYDYLINLFQLGLEACFFYHPLFWMLSREARSRREFCCDEVVLRHTSDPLLYAKTLTDLQISSLQPSTPFVMNATGKSRFTERILYIVGISPKRATRPNLFFALLLPLTIALGAWWPSSEAKTTEDLMNSSSVSALDSIRPPQKVADPTIARPREKASPETPYTLEKMADDLGKKYENQKISIDLEPAVSKNVAMELVKMNVFYIGVENPLKIAADGVPSSELSVKLIGDGSVTGKDGDYIVYVTKPGEVTIRVMHKVGNDIKFVVDQKYRVKRIPDPTARLDGLYRSSSISASTMQQSKGINIMLENFDFDAKCGILDFEVTYLAKDSDPITRFNTGGAWTPEVQAWIKMAKAGDAFYFDEIKVHCEGDSDARNIGGMVFKIKD